MNRSCDSTYEFDGARATALREARGLRPEHVALHVDRTVSRIYRYEKHNDMPPAPILLELCALYGCELSDLVHRVEPAERAAS